MHNMVVLCFVGPSEPQFDVHSVMNDSMNNQKVGIQIDLKVKSIRYTSGFCLILEAKSQDKGKIFTIERKNVISCKTSFTLNL